MNEQKNDATLEELVIQLEETIGVKVSRATMGRVVLKLKLTRKKKLSRATERETERVQQLRVQYWHEISQVKLENLVFVDETGSNLAMTRRYARSVRGSRAYNHAPYQRGQNVTPDWCNGVTGPSRRNYFSRRNGWSSFQDLCDSSISP